MLILIAITPYSDSLAILAIPAVLDILHACAVPDVRAKTGFADVHPMTQLAASWYSPQQPVHKFRLLYSDSSGQSHYNIGQ
jgi:hypothetical protein